MAPRTTQRQYPRIGVLAGAQLVSSRDGQERPPIFFTHGLSFPRRAWRIARGGGFGGSPRQRGRSARQAGDARGQPFPENRYKNTGELRSAR